MAASPTVAILFHGSITSEEMRSYRAFRFAEHWKQWGVRVRILHGINEPPNADLLIPQIDLSVMPQAYRDYVEAHPRVVNRGLYDIRRVRFSQNLVARDDAYEGPVVVKTNANFGGLPEHRSMSRAQLPKRVPYQLRHLFRRVSKKLANGRAKLAYTDFMEPRDYRVFPAKAEIPDSVFDNEALVVEKFRPEQQGEVYVSRNYAFFGSAGIAVWEKSKNPLIRGEHKILLELIPQDDKILDAQKSIGMEFGKLDYGLVDGEVVLFDVNPTPCSNFNVYPKIKQKIVVEMSKGIFDWFPDVRPKR